MRNNDRFFEHETPKCIEIKGGEVRLYPTAQRLSISKQRWVDAEGVARMGKTVTINLQQNAGNADLITMLSDAIKILKGGA